MKLKSLDTHNAEARERHRILSSNDPRPNGLACPKCGNELLDTQPNVILTSYPAQKNVGCSSKECDYRGYRVA
jgi:hypothetical protein